MLRRTSFLLLSLRDISERMDSFEKEVIELKAFRKAVEATAPEVAEKAKALIKEHMNAVKQVKVNIDNPLTADEFVELNQFYAVQMPRSIPIENLLFITTPNDLFRHAAAVHREYLVRVALLSRRLNHAPYGLSQMPSIKELKRWYQWTFHDIRNTEKPTGVEEAHEFDALVRRIFLRHYNVCGMLNNGFVELAKREQWAKFDDDLREGRKGLEAFFAEFCTGRARLRFLIGNYMYLSNKILGVQRNQYESFDPEGLTTPVFYDHSPEDFVGQICTKMSLLKLAKYAIREAQKGYEDAEITLNFKGEEDLTFTGIPYITFDILSAMLDDAIQANVERQEDFGVPCADIEVTLSQHSKNVNHSVRVSDSAGGVPLSVSQQALSCWSVFRNSRTYGEGSSTSRFQSPMRLPYEYRAAHMIGGDVASVSVEGFGCDRCFYLPSCGVNKVNI